MYAYLTLAREIVLEGHFSCRTFPAARGWYQDPIGLIISLSDSPCIGSIMINRELSRFF